MCGRNIYSIENVRFVRSKTPVSNDDKALWGRRYRSWAVRYYRRSYTVGYMAYRDKQTLTMSITGDIDKWTKFCAWCWDWLFMVRSVYMKATFLVREVEQPHRRKFLVTRRDRYIFQKLMMLSVGYYLKSSHVPRRNIWNRSKMGIKGEMTCPLWNENVIHSTTLKPPTSNL